MEKRTAQKDTIIDITGDSQVNRAICGDFKPENFSSVQSIYAGFVERNIPAIPRPVGSRGNKGLLHEKKKMSVQTRFFTLIGSGICSKKYGRSVPLNLLTQSALNRQSQIPHMWWKCSGKVVEKEFKNERKKKETE